MNLKKISNTKKKKEFLKIFSKNLKKDYLIQGKNKIKGKRLLSYICQICIFLKKKKLEKKNYHYSN